MVDQLRQAAVTIPEICKTDGGTVEIRMKHSCFWFTTRRKMRKTKWYGDEYGVVAGYADIALIILDRTRDMVYYFILTGRIPIYRMNLYVSLIEKLGLEFGKNTSEVLAV